jgi:hypothetical protein
MVERMLVKVFEPHNRSAHANLLLIEPEVKTGQATLLACDEHELSEAHTNRNTVDIVNPNKVVQQPLCDSSCASERIHHNTRRKTLPHIPKLALGHVNVDTATKLVVRNDQDQEVK